MKSGSKYTLADMHEIAALRGGRCLSKEYVSIYSPLNWMCAKGHTWDTSWSIVKQGGWCRQCASKSDKEYWLSEMNAIANSHGGRCISKEYINGFTRLKWECKEGHQWMASPGNISKGTWCKECVMAARRISIADLNKIARSRGGTCLSKEYLNSKIKLQWQCKEGHRWSALVQEIKAGSWCPFCSGSAPKTIVEMKRMARERGGKCLSAVYVNVNTNLKWQCSKKHTWSSKPANIIQGSWCPDCANEHNSEFRKFKIEEYKAAAEEHGGKLLSSRFIDSKSPMKWKCKEGHIFITKPIYIMHGSWCRECGIIRSGDKRRTTIQELRTFAASRRGKLLSKEYISYKRKLLWQCHKGHKWFALYGMVSYGRWCPVCYKTNPKEAIIFKRKYIHFSGSNNC